VRDIVLGVAQGRAGVVFYASTAHVIPEAPGARVVVVDQRPEEADIRIANAARLGDIVVTGDLGLAALCLARGAQVIDFRGEVLGPQMLPAMLERRHASAKARRGGGRMKGPRALTEADRAAFRRGLAGLLGAGPEPMPGDPDPV
jgi:hypothetical protein